MQQTPSAGQQAPQRPDVSSTSQPASQNDISSHHLPAVERVLFASAEAVPFAKVGGLADVLGSLPAAIRRNDVDARVVIPCYGLISQQQHRIRLFFNFSFTHDKGTTDVGVYTSIQHAVPVYLLRAWPYFGDGDQVYTEWVVG